MDRANEVVRRSQTGIDYEDVLTKAHLATNSGLRKDTTIDDTLSGTTGLSRLHQNE